MSYHLYHTPGLVLDVYHRGETHYTLLLLTREVGVLHARVQSARALASKLRPALSRFGMSDVSLVRGKGAWRVVGAAETRHYYYALAGAPEKQRLLARVCSLLKRLTPGEEANPALFVTVRDGFDFLLHSDLHAEDLKNLECMLVLRVLHTLGYVGEAGTVPPLSLGAPLSRELLAELAPLRRRAIATINESLQASHL